MVRRSTADKITALEGLSEVERIGIEPMDSSLHSYSGGRDAPRPADTNGSIHAGSPVAEGSQRSWLRRVVFGRLGQEWAT
jgi:hypothetical protein